MHTYTSTDTVEQCVCHWLPATLTHRRHHIDMNTQIHAKTHTDITATINAAIIKPTVREYTFIHVYIILYVYM